MEPELPAKRDRFDHLRAQIVLGASHEADLAPNPAAGVFEHRVGQGRPVHEELSVDHDFPLPEAEVNGVEGWRSDAPSERRGSVRMPYDCRFGEISRGN